MVRFRKLNNKFLRKHRKWPHSPYKTKWHLTFDQQQAMQLLKQLASSSTQQQQQQQQQRHRHRHQHQHQHQHQQPFLLSSLLHSFSLYNIDPIPKAYHFIIKTLTNTSQFHSINPILHHLQNFEKFETPEYIFVYLIKAYGQDANKLQQAIHLFYNIPNFRCVPTIYSLNCLLSLLCRHKSLQTIPHVLFKSHQMKIRLEDSTFHLLIATLCRIGQLGFAIEMLHCMLNYGYSVVDTRISSLILKSLSNSSKDTSFAAFDVFRFFQGLRKLGFSPSMRDYANIIKLLVRLGKVKDAYNVLTQMKSDGIKPDIVCYTLALNGAVENSDYVKADKVFDELLVLGLVPNVYTYNAYIRSFCKQNNVEAGIKMVKTMEELGCKPNVNTYNLVLGHLCKGGELNRAKEIVKEMESKSIGMNLKTYKVMIDALVGKVKRRLKTLMMRKKKRQSELEAEIAQRNNHPKEEAEVDSTCKYNILLQHDPPESETGPMIELELKSQTNNLAESCKGQLDLNCQPNHEEDGQAGIKRVSMMNLVQVATQPLETYLKQNGLMSLTSEQQINPETVMPPYTMGDSDGQVDKDQSSASAIQEEEEEEGDGGVEPCHLVEDQSVNNPE
ncbi:hypothetical protein ACFE04_001627 [Oxalis oulophora]